MPDQGAAAKTTCHVLGRFSAISVQTVMAYLNDGHMSAQNDRNRWCMGARSVQDFRVYRGSNTGLDR